MTAWTCPACGREFRRNNQGHTCLPAMSLEDRLDALDPNQRAICEAVLKLLPRIGDVHVEPVNVGLFLKHGRTFASLRMRRAGMRLLIMLPRPLDHPRLSYSRRADGTSRIAHATTTTERRPTSMPTCDRGWPSRTHLQRREGYESGIIPPWNHEFNTRRLRTASASPTRRWGVARRCCMSSASRFRTCEKSCRSQRFVDASRRWRRARR